MTTAKPRTPPQSSIMTGSKLGRKFDNEEEEGRRKKIKQIIKKKEDISRKRTTLTSLYLGLARTLGWPRTEDIYHQLKEEWEQ